MTREKLIELAREAGWDYANDSSGYDPLWKFGELVAAAERNRTWTQDHWTEYERSIVATEREAIATEFMKRHEAVKHLNNYWHHAAVYVRERGQDD
jgi:hypothetical protein